MCYRHDVNSIHLCKSFYIFRNHDGMVQIMNKKDDFEYNIVTRIIRVYNTRL